MFIFENTFDSKNQTRQTNEKFNERDEKNFKRKTYVLNKFKKKKIQKLVEKKFLVDNDNQSRQIYYFENLDYYNSNHFNQNNDSNKFVNNHFILSIIVKYRRYQKKFSFNNKLYLHFRNDWYFNANARLRKIFVKSSRLSKIAIKFVDLRKIFTIIVYAKTNFIIKITKITSIVVNSIIINSIVVTIILIVFFDINSFKNIDTSCDYRDWNYVKITIALSKIATSKSDYLNTKFDVILIDKIFWQKQNFDVFVRIMTTLLIVRDLSTNQYQIVDYVIVLMYFINEKNDKSTKIMIRWEMHLINNFKINMLINNDIIDSKR